MKLSERLEDACAGVLIAEATGNLNIMVRAVNKLLSEAREAATLARRVEDLEWVACSDRLPDPCDHVEVYPNTHEPQTHNFYANFNGGTDGVKAGNWYHNDEAGYHHIIHPTHWRPINTATPLSAEET